MDRPKRALHGVQTDIYDGFTGRIWALDEQAAWLWGKWSGEGKQRGILRPVLDTQIAAIAARQGAVLVTRNTNDVRELPVRVLNPWL